MNKLMKIYQKMLGYLVWFLAFSKKSSLKFIKNSNLNELEFELLEQAYFHHVKNKKINKIN